MKFLLLFLPFVLSYLLQDTPEASYWVAWLGSIFILWFSLSGRLKKLPGGYSLRFQLFRPIVFTQLVFATYTALTSVFYFLAVRRGELFVLPEGWAPPSIAMAAKAQGYYVLAHAAVTTGMFLAMNYEDSGMYAIRARWGHSRFLLGIASAFFLLTLITSQMPSMFQLTFRFREIATAAAVFSFALALINKEGTLVWLNALVFTLTIVSALLSGWKEEVLVLLIFFFLVLFPYYRRATLIVGSISLTAFVLIMPAYSAIYRPLAWYGNTSKEEASSMAFKAILSGEADLTTISQAFARDRLSEIGLFVGYLQQVPDKRPFYGSRLVEQSLVNLVPRMLWPEKPNTEALVMERVYENNIYSRRAIISAKPQFVVDGYLSAGAIGIILSCLMYGVLASVASRFAERWFGGYMMGSGLVYSGLFQIFWRGNSFEFFVGIVFWSTLLMVVMFHLGRSLGIVQRDYTVRPPVPLRPIPVAAARAVIVERDRTRTTVPGV
ncbi:MAG: hypothetical protein ABIQ55_04315 [Gemmatimonadaceae bacterium]